MKLLLQKCLLKCLRLLNCEDRELILESLRRCSSDKSLNLNSKGVYCYFLIHGYKGVSRRALAKYTSSGKRSIEDALEDLKKNGYLKVCRYRDHDGCFYYRYQLLNRDF